MQLVICANGQVGSLFEHSMIDGGSTAQLNNAVAQALLKQWPEPSATATSVAHPLSYARLQCTIDASLSKEIARVRQAFAESASPFHCEVQHLSLPGFGDNFFRQRSCSGKTGLQLTVQLASRFYFGQNQPPSWETVSMRSFRGGRVDIVQTVLPQVKAWCDRAAEKLPDIYNSFLSNATLGNAEDSTIDVVTSDAALDLRALFLAAAREHASNVTRTARGQGFAGHLYALQEVRQTKMMSDALTGPQDKPGQATSGGAGEEPCPRLFAPGSTFWRTRPGRILTDSVPWTRLDGLQQQGGWIMPVLDHVWFHYEAADDAYVFFFRSSSFFIAVLLFSAFAIACIR